MQGQIKPEVPVHQAVVCVGLTVREGMWMAEAALGACLSWSPMSLA